MSGSEIFIVLTWWFWILLLGWLFFPIVSTLFRGFTDKGYIFAKTLGLILFSYAIFFLGTLKIIVFDRLSLFFLLLLPLVLYFLFLMRKGNMIKRLQKYRKELSPFRLIFLVEELLFLSGLFFLLHVRSFSPDIHGLEKFMDYGFINSIGRATFFPPKDMWFPPLPINYYYFGHLMTAVLVKLTNIPSSIGYNLMLATIFALCLTSTFSLAGNLYGFLIQSKEFIKKRILIVSVIAALLVTLGGNLHTIYTLFTPYENESPVPVWTLAFSPNTFPNSYWYPNATRYIHNTIHEFPIYSWTVADLHGHVLDIPIVLLTLAILFSLFQRSYQAKLTSLSISVFGLTKTSVLSLYSLVIGFLLAVMYMTNAWDGIIYFLLSFFVILFALRTEITLHKKTSSMRQVLKAVVKSVPFLRHLFFSVLGIALSFFLFSQPFARFFKPFVSGVGVLCAPKFLTDIGHFGPLLFETDHCQHSPWWQLLILYGFFYFFVFSFFALLIKRSLAKRSDYFVLILILMSTLLLLIPEFIYVKDIYPAHYRANTMFKLAFQAFMMLGLSCGYILVRVMSFLKRNFYTFSVIKKILVFLYGGISIGLITLVMIYPYLAFNSYYGVWNNTDGQPAKTLTFDGLAYLKTLYPEDYELVLWMNENIKGQPVILEAQGDSYTDYARISTNTGLPTVLGWTVHEWLWRGSYDIPSPRIGDVTTLYETDDPRKAKDLLTQYDVKYIVIGDLERQKYPKLSEGKFKQIAKQIYQNGNTRLYQVF
ncbi:MAG: DUF2298 domain-containing protein [bacterium]|nr:DUF2298 domain-containing protein [bacterium]